MATLEELEQRVSSLETGLVDAQEEILKRAESAAVANLERARDYAKAEQDNRIKLLEDRVTRIERNLATFNLRQLKAVRLDANDEIATDLTFGQGQGVILKSANGTEFRIVVSDAGVLSTEPA